MSRKTALTAHRVTAHEYLTVRRVRERQNLERIYLIGEIDLCTAPLLQTVLADGQEATNVLVDLSQVNFLALAGVHVLQEAAARRASVNHRLVLAAPTAAVQRMFRLTDAAEHLDIYQSTPKALSALEV
jgi:anti-anti-sigma factor